MELRYGNTPTCMGKTARKKDFQFDQQKHPHVHGEDALDSLGDLLTKETPPRAWGRLADIYPPRTFARNTPTCMGKTRREGVGLKSV